MSHQLEIYNDLLERWLAYRNASLQCNFDIITQFRAIVEVEGAKNRDLGSGFNPLRQFAIDERTHSRIIGNLLNPRYGHGQQYLFLHHFLRILGIVSPERGPWIITMEEGSVDILLRRRDPHSVIVIENKSNFAVDQPNQLYRYWHEHIFLPNRDKKAWFQGRENYLLPEIRSRYRILYLSPDAGKVPSEISLRKPNWLNETFPEEIPIEPDFLLYRDFVPEWLMECRKSLPMSNYRLREYIDLYMDLWN